MLPVAETSQPPPRQPIARKSAKNIVWVLFFLWTLFLGGITWEIQHSCAPLVAWNGTLPAKCQTLEVKDTAPRSLVPNWLTHQDRGNSKLQNLPVAKRQPLEQLPANAVSLAAGSAAAIVSAVVGAPAIVTVGLGVAVWFFVKFFTKTASIS
jgi:hypothetical protein